jgi:hypothetical protein
VGALAFYRRSDEEALQRGGWGICTTGLTAPRRRRPGAGAGGSSGAGAWSWSPKGPAPEKRKAPARLPRLVGVRPSARARGPAAELAGPAAGPEARSQKTLDFAFDFGGSLLRGVLPPRSRMTALASKVYLVYIDPRVSHVIG